MSVATCSIVGNDRALELVADLLYALGYAL
jgi:hypothetical protein